MTAGPDGLLTRLLRGEPRALAKAITAVESDSETAAGLLARIEPHLGRALVIGITGAPGVGKSSLVSALITELRKQGKSIGVLAVDPSSPVSGGAILGDRIRMSAHASDPAVFVRSLASRGHLGGLPPAAARIIDVLDAAGRDVVIVETVGAGQSDIAIAALAEITVVVCAPGLGDDIQAIKAGILEIADILVVNKADLPSAGETLRQLQAMLSLRRGRAAAVPVLATTATEGGGVAELACEIEARAAARGGPGRAAGAEARVQNLLAEAVGRLAADRLRAAQYPKVRALCQAVRRGDLDVRTAAERALTQGMLTVE
jgi:LAO/AO transport system kinase